MSKKQTTFKVKFDGACSSNPGGTMGIGVVINKYGTQKNGAYPMKISKGYRSSGMNSNNLAEYLAIEKAIDFLLPRVTRNDKVIIQGDSRMVIMQMAGIFKIKNGHYTKKAEDCKIKIDQLKKKCNSVFVGWIPREENHEADALSKKGVDSVSGGRCELMQL